MKRNFRILALALIATALTFVACNKEEDNNKKTNNKQQQEEQPADTNPSIAVVFNESPVTLGRYDAKFDDAANPLLFQFAAVGVDDEGNSTLPQLQIGLQYDTNQAENRWSFTYIYYSDNQARWNEIKPSAEWTFRRVESASITDFSITDGVKMSFELTATMQNYYEFARQQVPEIEVSTAPLSVVARNIQFFNTQTPFPRD